MLFRLIQEYDNELHLTRVGDTNHSIIIQSYDYDYVTNDLNIHRATIIENDEEVAYKSTDAEFEEVLEHLEAETEQQRVEHNFDIDDWS